MNLLRLAAFAIAGLLAVPVWATLQAPTISFAPASIAGAGTTTMTILLDNNPPGNPSNIAFNFVYPANVFNAAAPAPATTCLGGTVSAPALGNSLSLSGASLSGNNTCTVTVTLRSCNQAIYSIGGFGVTSTSGNPTAGTANLTVTTSSPALAGTSTVSAGPGSVPADDTTTSTITVATRNVCGTGATNKTISLGQGAGNSTIAPGSAPTDANGVAAFTVRDGFAETVTYTATETVDGVVITQTAAVTFTALNAPTVTKGFAPGSITEGGTSTLTVTINNPNNATLTGLTFTDTYPGGLVNAATPALSNTCGGVATAAAGGNQLALTAGVLAGVSSCSVSVSVTSASAGSYLNSTGAVQSNNAVAGAAASATLTVVVAVTSFNVVEPGASATTGRIFTKIAGENFVVDIVALDALNNVATTFTGDVTVELVDACAAVTPVKTLAVQTFTVGDSGRHALSAGQFEANAYRNLLFRIKYPVASPTVTACSSDAFANRPKQFVGELAQDQDRTSAGVARTLDNTANPGIGPGAVHNAGRPFRLEATAQNGAVAPATTINYVPDAGQPVALLSQCGAGAVCPLVPGTLSTGAWSASNGIITSVTASYNDVGSFNLVLEDQTFANVDAGDTAPADRYFRSAVPLTVGRFVPDHFTVEAGSTITPRSDIGACSGSGYTYMDEPMTLAFTLTAREAGGAVTPGYSGATLGALALNAPGSYGIGAIDTAVPTPLTARVDDTLFTGGSGAWSAGTTGVIAAPIAIRRAAAPDGPYVALRIGVAPTDPDGVTLGAAGMDLDADNSGTPERAQVGPVLPPAAVRFGRLRLQNAYGPDTVGLQLPLQAQHWNGSSFVLNADDSCTTLAATDIALSGYTLNLGAGETSIVEATISVTAGSGKLTLSPPGAGNNGTVLLTPGLAAAARAYLQGKWTGATWDEDPSARATFGLYGSQPKNFIFFRENY